MLKKKLFAILSNAQGQHRIPATQYESWQHRKRLSNGNTIRDHKYWGRCHLPVR